MQNASDPLAPWMPHWMSWDVVAAPMMLQLERHFGIRRLKRGMLAMLAGWLGYFVIISMSLRTLNKVMVPMLDVPLGVFLAVQGAAIVFLAALIVLVRAAATAPR